jgi:lysophospholipase L1-like esterase
MGIVGDVFGDLSVINCGLLANEPGIIIQDWNFSNVSNAGNDSSLMTALGGKTLSVLGDSISTWGGVSNNTAYNTTIGTNNPYYNGGNMTTLSALNQTYWGSVMGKYNMSLCVNNSFSSGRLVEDWIADSNGVHIPSALTRCTELANKNGITPDVIAIYIGTNDFKTPKSEAGDYTTAEEFGIAYQTMLDSIATQYSGAKVFCFTLIPNNQRTDQTEWNAYNEQIRTVVANNDCAVLVDIAQNSGIDWNNYTNYTVDGVHPNLAGMKKIADVFENALYATYVQ